MSYFLPYLYMYPDVCGCVKGEQGIEMELCMKTMPSLATGYTQNIDGEYTSLIQNNLVLPTDQTY